MKTLTKKIGGCTLTIEKTDNITFPVGTKILVTDPCYWFGQGENDHIWQAFCDMMFPDNYTNFPEHEKLYTYGKVTFTTEQGRKIVFLYTSTASGDGSYDVKTGSYGEMKHISGDGFGVDAGMYAVVALEDAKHLCPKDFKKDKYDHGVIFEVRVQAPIYVDGEDMSGALVCVTGDKEEEICEHCGSSRADYDGVICSDCHDEQEREEEENEDED